MAAGGMTRSNTSDSFGGIKLPPIEREPRDGRMGEGGGSQGPEPVTYLDSFDDAAAGKEQALALIRGADVLTHNADAAALGLFQAVKEVSDGVCRRRQCRPVRARSRAGPRSAVIDLRRAFLLVGKEVKEGHSSARGVVRAGERSGPLRLGYCGRKARSGALQARISAARDSIHRRNVVAVGPQPLTSDRNAPTSSLAAVVSG